MGVTGGVAVLFTGVALLTVQSAFKVAPLGVVVQVGGARLSDCCHTAGRVPACISHATFAWLFASTCLLSIGVVGAGAIGVIAGATHATGAFAIAGISQYDCFLAVIGSTPLLRSSKNLSLFVAIGFLVSKLRFYGVSFFVK